MRFEFDHSAINDFLNDLEHFEIECPECDHAFKVSIDDIGNIVTCPHCSEKIKLESE